MRLSAMSFITMLAVVTVPLSATATSAQPYRAARDNIPGAAPAAVQYSPYNTSAAYACPPGYYWEPDSYAAHGKFRVAHCARR